MNYKQLLPTFRNRFLFVEQNLRRYVGTTPVARALNAGTGEGEYDGMIAAYAQTLVASDINADDVAFAQQFNRDVPNIQYMVDNVLALSFPDAHFDLVVSSEVIEHVGQPAVMMREIARVLRPGGKAIITFPSLDFPFTYDPVNRTLAAVSGGKVSQGAYSFGHDYLISPREFRQWAADNGLKILHEQNLSGYLVGLLEAYWTGWIQSLLKANAANLSEGNNKKMVLRPTTQQPLLLPLVDVLIRVDFALFGRRRHSVGKGFVLEKSGL